MIHVSKWHRAEGLGGAIFATAIQWYNRCYGASGDEIASIGKLLTERWLHRRRCQPCRWSPSMRKPKKQKKPLNDLSRSLTPFDPNHSLIAELARCRDRAGRGAPAVEEARS